MQRIWRNSSKDTKKTNHQTIFWKKRHHLLQKCLKNLECHYDKRRIIQENIVNYPLILHLILIIRRLQRIYPLVIRLLSYT